ncbi:TPA: DUF2684 family protein [Serratia fonticola]|nr:DUF2684 family protein [Serratia fonticola]
MRLHSVSGPGQLDAPSGKAASSREYGRIRRHRLDVNQFRWKTIWTAILGHTVSTFPVLFRIPHVYASGQMEEIPDTFHRIQTKILLFHPADCIKRRCCRPQYKRMTPPCVAPSELFSDFHPGRFSFAVCRRWR